MAMNISRRCFPVLLVSILLFSLSGTSGAEKTAEELLPANTIFYAEIGDPAGLTETLVEHPLVEKLLELDAYQQVLSTPEFEQFKLLLAAAEEQVGATWQEALSDLAVGGISVAFDMDTQGGAVLVEARDKESLDHLRDTFLKLVATEASNNGQQDPVKRGSYRDITAYQLNEQFKFITIDNWLIVVTESKLGSAILDRYLDSGQGLHETLAETDAFQAARRTMQGEETAWAYLGLKQVRVFGGLVPLSTAARENMFVELLLGGVVEAAKSADFMTATIQLDEERARIALALPCDDTSLKEGREYFFGPGGQGVAPAIINVDDTIFSLSTYRDISQVWLRAPDLFTDEVNDGLAEADSTLTTLFAGRDFGEDILGALRPQLQLIVARQEFDSRRPIPRIKLPSFALVGQMRDPEVMTAELRRIAISMIGFFNVVGAMEGQPQMDIEIEKLGQAQLVSATFLPDPNQQPSQVKIQYNFSPTVVFHDQLLIVSSTRTLAEQLLAGSEKLGPPTEANTALRVDLPALERILADNRQQLIVQNILEEGSTQEEAAGQIDIILKLLGLARSFEMALERGDGQIRLQATLSY
jgi:hypothetical protein